MTEMIKNKINLKNSLNKSNKFMEIQKLLTKMPIMICKRKEEYHNHLSTKLNNPSTSAKTCL